MRGHLHDQTARHPRRFGSTSRVQTGSLHRCRRTQRRVGSTPGDRAACAVAELEPPIPAKGAWPPGGGPIPLALQPLACAQCGAPVPVADAESRPCPSCGAVVPMPEEHRALREAGRVLQAGRREAQALYRELGRPPGPWLRAWAAVATGAGWLVASVFGLLLYVGGAATVVAFFVLELGLHALAPEIGRDWVDVYGGGGAYLRVLLGLEVLVLLPIALCGAAARSAELRREVQAALAAAPPATPAGPARCRRCLAALEVEAGALGARCLYCGADNLLRLPAAWVEAARREDLRQLGAIEAVRRQGREALQAEHSERWTLAVGCVLALPVGWGAGWLAVVLDSDLEPPPGWSQARGPPRRLIGPDGQAVALGAGAQVRLGSPGLNDRCSARWYAALERGETLAAWSQQLTGQSGAAVRNTTSFPFLAHGADCGWRALGGGAYGCQFTAPYTGFFALELSTQGSRCLSGVDLAWGLGPLPGRGPAALPDVRRRLLTRHAQAVGQVAISADGALVASLAGDGTLWLGARGEGGGGGGGGGALVPASELGGGATSFAPGADGTSLVVGARDRRLRLLEWPRGTVRQVLEAAGGPVLAVAASLDGRRLAASGEGGQVWLWSAADHFQTARTLGVGAGPGIALAFTSDGGRLAAGGRDGHVRLWSVETGALAADLTDSGPVRALALGPHVVVTAPSYPTASIWLLAERPRFFDGLWQHALAVQAVALSGDEDTVVTGSADRSLRLWATGSGGERYELDDLPAGVTSVALSPDATALVAGLADGQVLLFERGTGARLDAAGP
jgi:WD40 repeat protein